MNGSAPFDEPGRKNPAAGVPFRVGEPNIVLLTVNTEQRTPWLATPEVHRQLHQTWQEATGWLVGDYLLMPDHLHCFCAPHDLRFDIEPWITYWKRELRRKHGRAEWRFQSRGWHHRIRDAAHYAEKWHYVRENPVRRGLVEQGDAWPHQGRVHALCW
jgi:putative transposase